MIRNVPILSVNVPFKREKSSALMNAAIPVWREVLAPVNIPAFIPTNSSTVAKSCAETGRGVRPALLSRDGASGRVALVYMEPVTSIRKTRAF
jgi:hypothetical protein